MSNDLIESVRRRNERGSAARSRRGSRWLVVLAVLLPGLLLSTVISGLDQGEGSIDVANGPPQLGEQLAAVEPSSAPRAEFEPQIYEEVKPAPAPDGSSALERPPAGDGVAENGKDPSKFDCLIEPNKIVSLGSPITGSIEEILVERGDSVEAGRVVARLESGVEKAAVKVAETRASLDGAIKANETRMVLGKKRQQRANQLFQENVLSLDLRDEAETEAEVARLDLQRAREEQRLASLELQQALAILKRRTITTPVSGVVVDRLMSPGETVDKQTIVTIAEIDPLRVEVVLPSAMFGSVKPGMRAAVEPESPGNLRHVASVKIVDKIIDAASGTFRVLLELPNADHQIPGGLHCQVRFLTD